MGEGGREGGMDEGRGGRVMVNDGSLALDYRLPTRDGLLLPGSKLTLRKKTT